MHTEWTRAACPKELRQFIRDGYSPRGSGQVYNVVGPNKGYELLLTKQLRKTQSDARVGAASKRSLAHLETTAHLPLRQQRPRGGGEFSPNESISSNSQEGLNSSVAKQRKGLRRCPALASSSSAFTLKNQGSCHELHRVSSSAEAKRLFSSSSQEELSLEVAVKPEPKGCCPWYTSLEEFKQLLDGLQAGETVVLGKARTIEGNTLLPHFCSLPVDKLEANAEEELCQWVIYMIDESYRSGYSDLAEAGSPEERGRSGSFIELLRKLLKMPSTQKMIQQEPRLKEGFSTLYCQLTLKESWLCHKRIAPLLEKQELQKQLLPLLLKSSTEVIPEATSWQSSIKAWADRYRRLESLFSASYATREWLLATLVAEETTEGKLVEKNELEGDWQWGRIDSFWEKKLTPLEKQWLEEERKLQQALAALLNKYIGEVSQIGLMTHAVAELYKAKLTRVSSANQEKPHWELLIQLVQELAAYMPPWRP